MCPMAPRKDITLNIARKSQGKYTLRTISHDKGFITKLLSCWVNQTKCRCMILFLVPSIGECILQLFTELFHQFLQQVYLIVVHLFHNMYFRIEQLYFRNPGLCFRKVIILYEKFSTVPIFSKMFQKDPLLQKNKCLRPSFHIKF